MTLTRLLLLLALAGLAYHLWGARTHPGPWGRVAQLQAQIDAPVHAQADLQGFIPIGLPGTERGVVLVLAALNCPRDASQRADDLAEQLRGMGIAVKRDNHYPIQGRISIAQLEPVKRLNLVMNQGAPAVFINGMGKSNPSLDEVVAEYKQTQASDE